MSTKTTRDVLESYLHCKYKGWLRLAGERCAQSEYESLLSEARADVKRAAIEKILAQCPEHEVASTGPLNTLLLRRGLPFILDAVLVTSEVLILFDGLKQVQGPSKLGDYHYAPMLFHDRRQIRREQKLLLELCGLLLSRLQGKAPAIGIVWHGKDCKATRLRLAPGFPKAEQVLRELNELGDAKSPPPLLLNDHCHICEFRQRCHDEAIDQDNLSLLRGMGEKEIRKYNRKGIFTTTQLSCTFRPRRRGKRVRNPSSIHYYALQALAIRDSKTFVYAAPTLPMPKTRVYFDVEGDPDRGFAYLLGAIVVTPEEVRRCSFWADGPGDEDRVFQHFLALLGGLNDFCIYHYGSYESSFLKRMKKHARKKTHIDNAIRNSVNILTLLRSHVYFPTYSNSLKDIATHLGYAWATPGATGIQSIIWRTRWERTLDDALKSRLIQYNLDDCAALRLVTEYLYGIVAMSGALGSSTEATGQPGIAWVHEIAMQTTSRREWGDPGFCLPDFDYVNKCAYFDYQRERVFLRTNPTLRRITITRRSRERHKHPRPNRNISIRATKCPFCGGGDLRRFENQTHVKLGFDLRITRSGMARRVIACVAAVHQCLKCVRCFLPRRYKRRDKHFHALKSWAMYQHIVHRVSFQGLEAMLSEYFDLRINYQELYMIKSLMAARYQATYRSLLKKLVGGEVIHVDETHANLQKGKGYVWVLTNLEEVIYLYKPSREGEFLHSLLGNFKGVLVSDFFSAYDSLPCEQQKCLVHLIRDLNHDLLGSPFDEEFKSLAGDFGQLLRLIIGTIDRHGLKKRHLQKHVKDVDRFFEHLGKRHYRSEVAGSYQERLTRNQAKLFTFLRHDGVPWNNNNAEHAIKRYARYRVISDGKVTATGLADYLVMLSMHQTCEYKGVSFLKFLLSQESDIDAFCEAGGRKWPDSQLEVYPNGFPHMYGPKGKRGQPNKAN